MYKATRPFEYLCFFPMVIPTTDKGDMYAFFAYDIFSKQVIMPGVEEKHNMGSVLRNIELLTQDADFQEQYGEAFTLIVPNAYSDFIENIDSFISPYMGKVIVDDLFVTEMMEPAMEEILKK